MKLQMLSFEGDKILERKLKEASNYRDNAHIYTATFGIVRLILSELSPIDLDGNSKLTIVTNVEQQMIGNLGYNCDKFFKVSFFNLDRDTSCKLYQFKEYDYNFQMFIAALLLDMLKYIDDKNGGKNQLSQKREYIMERLKNCSFQKDILLEKFSKVSPNKKYSSKVYQCLSQSIGEGIKAEVIDRASNEIVVSKWLTEIPGYIDRVSLIHRTFWNQNRFYIEFGKTEPRKTSYIDSGVNGDYLETEY